MITHCKIELTNEQRSALAALVDGRESSRLLSRLEVNAFVTRCINEWIALALRGDQVELSTDEAGDLVIPDIDRGGWTFINQRELEL